MAAAVAALLAVSAILRLMDQPGVHRVRGTVHSVRSVAEATEICVVVASADDTVARRRECLAGVSASRYRPRTGECVDVALRDENSELSVETTHGCFAARR